MRSTSASSRHSRAGGNPRPPSSLFCGFGLRNVSFEIVACSLPGGRSGSVSIQPFPKILPLASTEPQGALENLPNLATEGATLETRKEAVAIGRNL